MKPNTSYDPYQALASGLGPGDALNRFLLSSPRHKIVQLLKGQRVLDVCCGTGNLTAMLARAGCEVVGVDSSPTMLSFAQQKGIGAGFQLFDATRLPFEREFDAAVISIALHEMRAVVREQVWAAMCRAVRPQGRLIVLDYSVPRTGNLLGRIMGALVEQDEHSLVSIHREHYENFREFMQGGGLRAWIRQRGEPVDAEYDYWGGILVTMICRREMS